MHGDAIAHLTHVYFAVSAARLQNHLGVHQSQPVASAAMVEDYPRTLMELERRFSDESSCRAYLFAVPWSEGFICPACGGRRGLAIRRDLWRCGACRRETSVMAGTIFQDSKLPLTVWFRAMWQVTSQKNGMSALGLQRVLGLGSYKTAWAMLHKLRRGDGDAGADDRLDDVKRVERSLPADAVDALDQKHAPRSHLALTDEREKGRQSPALSVVARSGRDTQIMKTRAGVERQALVTAIRGRSLILPSP